MKWLDWYSGASMTCFPAVGGTRNGRVSYRECTMSRQADQVTKMYYAEFLAASVMYDEVKVCLSSLRRQLLGYTAGWTKIGKIFTTVPRESE